MMKSTILLSTLIFFPAVSFADQTKVITSDDISPSYRSIRDISQIRGEGLEYLNQMREATGMTTYKQNTILDTAAQNHANYLLLNNYSGGHYESSNDSGYTGYAPSDRALYAGYQTGVGENLTYASAGESVQSSIDGLFAAIYHRIGFLGFSWDEVGIGASNGQIHHVFNMGDSNVNNLCQGSSYTGGGYYNICSANPDFVVEADAYDQAVNANKASNPAVVLWPAENQQDIPPVFFEESPDPLPDYSVSGYPVSLHFNDYYVSSVSLQSLELYDSQGNALTNIRMLDESSDPNSRFSAYDFTLFPLERLDWGTTYTAKASYTVDGVNIDKEWSFTTKTPEYPYYVVSNSGQTLEVQSGQTYAFYIPPQNAYDDGSGWSSSMDGGFSFDDKGYVDHNTPYFKVSGATGLQARITAGNTVFTLIISDTDSAINEASKTAIDANALAGQSYTIGEGASGFYHLYESGQWLLYMPASNYIIVHEGGHSDQITTLNSSDFSSVDYDNGTVTFGTYSGSESQGYSLSGNSYTVSDSTTSGFYHQYDDNLWFLYMPSINYLLLHESGKTDEDEGAVSYSGSMPFSVNYTENSVSFGSL